MENATKALLIAAAVLIAIVLVALGVNLLSSTGDTTSQAGETANQIGTSTDLKSAALAVALYKANGGKTITVSLDGEKITWPEGMSVGQAIEAGYADSRWQIEDTGGGLMIVSFDGKTVAYKDDEGLIRFVGSPSWVPLKGVKYTLIAQ